MEYEGVLWGIRGCWGVQGGVGGHEGCWGVRVWERRGKLQYNTIQRTWFPLSQLMLHQHQQNTGMPGDPEEKRISEDER